MDWSHMASYLYINSAAVISLHCGRTLVRFAEQTSGFWVGRLTGDPAAESVTFKSARSGIRTGKS